MKIVFTNPNESDASNRWHGYLILQEDESMSPCCWGVTVDGCQSLTIVEAHKVGEVARRQWVINLSNRWSLLRNMNQFYFDAMLADIDFVLPVIKLLGPRRCQVAILSRHKARLSPNQEPCKRLVGYISIAHKIPAGYISID